MKKFMENATSMDDLKNAIVDLQKREDKKGFYIFIAIITALLIATLCMVVCFLKKKMNDDYDEDWDCDWDDDSAENDFDCCCTDKDVDTSVKVEKL